MQTLAEVDTRTIKCIDERGFHETGFVDRATWMIVRARRPLDHPMKDFELAELRLPWWDAFGAQIIYEGLLTGSCPYRQ